MRHDDLRRQQQQHITTVNKLFCGLSGSYCVFDHACPWYGTWWPAVLVGAPAALIPSALMFARPHALVTRLSVGVAVIVFCALNIHQARGTELRPWHVPVDVALPCATQNELGINDAEILMKNGVLCVAEGAHMPSTKEAAKAFEGLPLDVPAGADLERSSWPDTGVRPTADAFDPN